MRDCYLIEVYVLHCAYFAETNALSVYSTPQDCEMTECNEYITGWTLGIQGSCLKDHYGIKIGTDGYRVAVMEVGTMNVKVW